jgi:glycopeptide antibiotics resistance protein
VNRGSWGFWLWTGLILLLVLPWTTFQNHTHWQRVAWIPFVSPPVRLRDVVANVLLYAPWGYLFTRQMPHAMRRIWIVVLFSTVLSLSTEASQLYSHGRFPSATDLICNIFGAVAGATFARRRSAI